MDSLTKVKKLGKLLLFYEDHLSGLNCDAIKNIVKHAKALVGDEFPENAKELFIDCIPKYIDYIIGYYAQQNVSKKAIFNVREFLRIVSCVVNSNNIKDLFVEKISKQIFDTLLESLVRPWYGKELLKIYNECIHGSSRDVRQKMLEDIGLIYLYKLVDTLSVYGDYEFQTVIVETVFRVCKKSTLDTLSCDFIPESKDLSKALLEINTDSFDEDIRLFLNMLNAKKNQCFTVICKWIKLDNITFKEPLQQKKYNGIWMDFDLRDHTISWTYDKRSVCTMSEDDNSPLLFATLLTKNVEKIDIHRPKQTQRRDLLVILTLNSCCITHEEVQSEIEDARTVKFYLSNCDKINSLITNVFPALFGKNYLNKPENVKKISSTRKIYKPLNIIRRRRSHISMSDLTFSESVRSSAKKKISTNKSANKKLSATSHSLEATTIHSDTSLNASSVESLDPNCKVLNKNSSIMRKDKVCNNSNSLKSELCLIKRNGTKQTKKLSTFRYSGTFDIIDERKNNYQSSSESQVKGNFRKISKPISLIEADKDDIDQQNEYDQSSDILAIPNDKKPARKISTARNNEKDVEMLSDKLKQPLDKPIESNKNELLLSIDVTSDKNNLVSRDDGQPQDNVISQNSNLIKTEINERCSSQQSQISSNDDIFDRLTQINPDEVPCLQASKQTINDNSQDTIILYSGKERLSQPVVIDTRQLQLSSQAGNAGEDSKQTIIGNSQETIILYSGKDRQKPVVIDARRSELSSQVVNADEASKQRIIGNSQETIIMCSGEQRHQEKPVVIDARQLKFSSQVVKLNELVERTIVGNYKQNEATVKPNSNCEFYTAPEEIQFCLHSQNADSIPQTGSITEEFATCTALDKQPEQSLQTSGKVLEVEYAGVSNKEVSSSEGIVNAPEQSLQTSGKVLEVEYAGVSNKEVSSFECIVNAALPNDSITRKDVHSKAKDDIDDLQVNESFQNKSDKEESSKTVDKVLYPEGSSIINKKNLFSKGKIDVQQDLSTKSNIHSKTKLSHSHEVNESLSQNKSDTQESCTKQSKRVLKSVENQPLVKLLRSKIIEKKLTYNKQNSSDLPNISKLSHFNSTDITENDKVKIEKSKTKNKQSKAIEFNSANDTAGSNSTKEEITKSKKIVEHTKQRFFKIKLKDPKKKKNLKGHQLDENSSPSDDIPLADLVKKQEQALKLSEELGKVNQEIDFMTRFSGTVRNVTLPSLEIQQPVKPLNEKISITDSANQNIRIVKETKNENNICHKIDKMKILSQVSQINMQNNESKVSDIASKSETSQQHLIHNIFLNENTAKSVQDEIFVENTSMTEDCTNEKDIPEAAVVVPENDNITVVCDTVSSDLLKTCSFAKNIDGNDIEESVEQIVMFVNDKVDQIDNTLPHKAPAFFSDAEVLNVDAEMSNNQSILPKTNKEIGQVDNSVTDKSADILSDVQPLLCNEKDDIALDRADILSDAEPIFCNEEDIIALDAHTFSQKSEKTDQHSTCLQIRSCSDNMQQNPVDFNAENTIQTEINKERMEKVEAVIYTRQRSFVDVVSDKHETVLENEIINETDIFTQNKNNIAELNHPSVSEISKQHIPLETQRPDEDFSDFEKIQSLEEVEKTSNEANNEERQTNKQCEEITDNQTMYEASSNKNRYDVVASGLPNFTFSTSVSGSRKRKLYNPDDISYLDEITETTSNTTAFGGSRFADNSRFQKDEKPNSRISQKEIKKQGEKLKARSNLQNIKDVTSNDNTKIESNVTRESSNQMQRNEKEAKNEKSSAKVNLENTKKQIPQLKENKTKKHPSREPRIKRIEKTYKKKRNSKQNDFTIVIDNMFKHFESDKSKRDRHLDEFKFSFDNIIDSFNKELNNTSKNTKQRKSKLYIPKSYSHESEKPILKKRQSKRGKSKHNHLKDLAKTPPHETEKMKIQKNNKTEKIVHNQNNPKNEGDPSYLNPEAVVKPKINIISNIVLNTKRNNSLDEPSSKRTKFDHSISEGAVSYVPSIMPDVNIIDELNTPPNDDAYFQVSQFTEQGEMPEWKSKKMCEIQSWIATGKFIDTRLIKNVLKAGAEMFTTICDIGRGGVDQNITDEYKDVVKVCDILEKYLKNDGT